MPKKKQKEEKLFDCFYGIQYKGVNYLSADRDTVTFNLSYHPTIRPIYRTLGAAKGRVREILRCAEGYNQRYDLYKGVYAPYNGGAPNPLPPKNDIDQLKKDLSIIAYVPLETVWTADQT